MLYNPHSQNVADNRSREVNLLFTKHPRSALKGRLENWWKQSMLPHVERFSDDNEKKFFQIA